MGGEVLFFQKCRAKGGGSIVGNKERYGNMLVCLFREKGKRTSLILEFVKKWKKEEKRVIEEEKREAEGDYSVSFFTRGGGLKR